LNRVINLDLRPLSARNAWDLQGTSLDSTKAQRSLQQPPQKRDIIYWLVVLTILKNISQWKGLSHILWKIQMFETTNQCNSV